MTARHLALAAAVLAALAAPSTGAAAIPDGAAWSEQSFSSTDGTRLHADVFRPVAPEERGTPVLLVISPYLGLPSSDQPAGPHVPYWYGRLYREALDRGFAVAQVSVRGTGASEGCLDYGGPGERGDVASSVRWAAAQPWSNGRVGVLGHSYDGLAGVIALADRVEGVDGVVLIGPVVDLYRGAYMNGVPYLQGRVAAPYYQALGVIPPLPGSVDTAPALLSRLADPACPARTIAGSEDDRPEAPFWRARAFVGRASGSHTPVFLAQGFFDGKDDYSAVRPDSFLGLWETLAGPRRAWLGQFSHVVPGEADTWGAPQPVGRDGFAAEALDWLEAHVAGDPSAQARVTAAPRIALQEGATGAWRSASRWRPAEAEIHTLRVLPGAYRDLPGNKAEAGPGPAGTCLALQARCNPLASPGGGSWTVSKPLARDMQLAGVPRLSVSARAPLARANLIAIAYDIDRSGRASLMTRGAYLLRAPGLSVSFDLYPQDWLLRAGHRIGLLLAGSDDLYFAPVSTGAEVRVVEGSLAVPLLAPAPANDLPGGPSRLVTDRAPFTVPTATLATRTAPLEAPAK